MAHQTPSGEPLLTRYRIFTTDDGGQTLRYVGSQDATGSDAALRQKLPADTVGAYCAVSENHLKLRNLKARPGPVIETEPLTWAEPAAAKPDEPATA